MNELAIDTKDLAKTYAGIRAVGGINLTVRADRSMDSRPQRGRQNNHDQNVARTCTPHGRSARVFGMDASSEHIAILHAPLCQREKDSIFRPDAIRTGAI